MSSVPSEKQKKNAKKGQGPVENELQKTSPEGLQTAVI